MAFAKGGKQYVVGGREFPISDQGSGAVMGLRLIQQVLLAQDGIRPHTPLCDVVMNHFNHDIDSIVAWSKTALPRDYGQFSPQIFSHAYCAILSRLNYSNRPPQTLKCS